jgi:tetratricopeptide (TPR) repeat protein
VTAAYREHFGTADDLMRRGALGEAERSLLLALKELRGYPPQDARWLEIYSNLAKLYIQQANYGRAAQIYVRSLRILEKLNQASYLKTVA